MEIFLRLSTGLQIYASVSAFLDNLWYSPHPFLNPPISISLFDTKVTHSSHSYHNALHISPSPSDLNFAIVNQCTFTSSVCSGHLSYVCTSYFNHVAFFLFISTPNVTPHNPNPIYLVSLNFLAQLHFRPSMQPISYDLKLKENYLPRISI
jgi:hypothetical protein